MHSPLLCWRVPRHRPSTLSIMAAVPFELIRIAERFRYRVSTTTADREPGARTTMKKSTVRASSRLGRPESIHRRPTWAPCGPNRLLRLNPSPEPSTATANVVPADTSTSTRPPASAPAPQVEQDAAPLAKPAPAPVVATAPAQPTPAPATSAVPSAASPVGLWSTEEKEGKVRIEPCGPNLCGYSVDARSSHNGEQVLINMKPGKDAKWHGRIHDPKTGSNYDSTIALKGPEFLRVQGCAFGGMFCGAQTWSRLN